MGLYCVLLFVTHQVFAIPIAHPDRKLIRPILFCNMYTSTKMNDAEAAKKIQKWWQNRSFTSPSLRRVMNALHAIPKSQLQEYVNKCHSITRTCKGGDGAGLLGGSLNDMLTCAFFERVFGKDYSDYHQGECDFTLFRVPLSFKKIHGKSTIALNWSKNKESGGNCTSPPPPPPPYFQSHILILNLKTQVWWQRVRQGRNQEILSGFYLVDKQFCRNHITLGKNNKTNSLIDSVQLYSMLQHSISQDLFLALPAPTESMKFCIWDSFQLQNL